MELQEQKQTPSRGRRHILPVILAALLALGGGALACHIHQVNVQQADLVL